MKVIRDSLWLCSDCTMAACNGDFTGFNSDEDIEDTKKGLNALGPNLVPSFDAETGKGIETFSHNGCDCCDRNSNCGTIVSYEFAILGRIA